MADKTTFEDVESLLADRLSIITEGKGHWAECMQAIEAYGKSCAEEARAEAASKRNSLWCDAMRWAGLGGLMRGKIRMRVINMADKARSTTPPEGGR